jgi:DnaK suppressor protein
MSGNTLPSEIVDGLRRALLPWQRALFDEIDGVEEDLRAIEESLEAEAEMRGQWETMDRLLDHIRERDRGALAEIHRALVKIPAGRYGICDNCQTLIGTSRLEAVPEARWCVDCAAERESERHAPGRPFEPGAHHPVPEEYRDFDDEELAEAVREGIRAHGDPDLLDIRIRCHGGVVRLSGRIPEEPQRRVLRQIIADGMGLDLIDRLGVVASDRELLGEREPEREEAVSVEESIPSGCAA